MSSASQAIQIHRNALFCICLIQALTSGAFPWLPFPNAQMWLVKVSVGLCPTPQCHMSPFLLPPNFPQLHPFYSELSASCAVTLNATFFSLSPLDPCHVIFQENSLLLHWLTSLVRSLSREGFFTDPPMLVKRPHQGLCSTQQSICGSTQHLSHPPTFTRTEIQRELYLPYHCLPGPHGWH